MENYEKSRIQLAHEVNALLKDQRMMIRETIPELIKTAIVETNANAGKARKIAHSFGKGVTLLEARIWEVGMTTNPGDIVATEDGDIFIFTSDAPMTHTNHLFYPGAVGVYYWTIIPHTYKGIRVYPNIPGIIVAVEKGDIWWDEDTINLYEYVGEDNDNCVWAPGEESNLWKEMDT